ncbi:MAG: mycofactocin precursor MftA [Desulfobacteraceae bacterium]|nr:mycofactocin precursor MftA [Desulfobacteraceae bacterium]MCF8094868.1 mycofactocin precursor MftA [Desulfobacteraceae bacterium]
MSENLQATMEPVGGSVGQKDHKRDGKTEFRDNQRDISDISSDGNQSDVLNITRINVEEVAIDGICGVY